MSRSWKKILVTVIVAVFLAGTAAVTAYAADGDTYEKGQTVRGSFAAEDGLDIATIRYRTDASGSEYAWADFSYNNTTDSYDYSFKAPYDGFKAVEWEAQIRTSSETPGAEATIIAEYYTSSVWDGTVDVSWYDPQKSSFDITTPAQLAGVAAIVNGAVDIDTMPWNVKGTRGAVDAARAATDPDKGLPDCIEHVFKEEISLPMAADKGYMGLPQYDFSDKTIRIASDMNMGGAAGSAINGTANADTNTYDYPNWMPIGGEFLRGPDDYDTMNVSYFNGTIEGDGHSIYNLYCYRRNYQKKGYNSFSYSQGVGFIGMMGARYDGEANPEIAPAVRNMSLDGYVYGRRMVGGIVGAIGSGSNAVNADPVTGGICLENLANYAYVYNTDSKGVGGIVGTSMAAGSIINCINRGNIDTTYATPAGGIVGSNEAMDIYCCYNAGYLNSHGNSRGRAIGCDNGGSNYTVSDCYYLKGTGDDSAYPGYYTYNLADSVSVTVTGLKGSEMTDGTLLADLNVNGKAYVAGDDGYPVLCWQKESDSGTVSVEQPDGGTVTCRIGTFNNGTVIYLSQEADTGWNFRNYTLNGDPVTGDYITVHGDSVISADYESVMGGSIRLDPRKEVKITVVKRGIIVTEKGVEEVTDYPVASGDPVYEGDVLTVTANLKDGAVPADRSMDYMADVGLENPYTYAYTYTGEETQETSLITFTVDERIAAEGTSLTLEVIPRTTPKLWAALADTSWYDGSGNEFTLTTAEQLAGLDALVESGEAFENVTITLGNDISLANSDGSGGIRYWNGIGNAGNGFKGDLNGNGHSISDMSALGSGFMAYLNGGSIENISIYGTAADNTACGVVTLSQNGKISSCNSYVDITGTGSSLYIGGILGRDMAGTQIRNCFNYGNIAAFGRVGGIAGALSSTGSIVSSANYGHIRVLNTGNNQVGGVAGDLAGASIKTSANYGNITAYGRNVGGIAGQATRTGSSVAEITGCCNLGTITLEDSTQTLDSVGGIIGYGSCYKINNSYNYGAVAASGTTAHVGAVVGRELKNSSSLTNDVYYLDSVCGYASDGVAYADLPAATYSSGIIKASASDFSDLAKVLKAINDDSVYTLKGKYPELIDIVGNAHVHSGGTATCSKLAVCSGCDLTYGEYDSSVHGETEIRNKKDAVWNIDGDTGDVYCTDCGQLVNKGQTIPADDTMTALTVTVQAIGSTDAFNKEYTIKEFDKLKTTGTVIAYGYGGSNTEIMVSTRYVTLTDLFRDLGINREDVEYVEVFCSDGAYLKVDNTTLTQCCYYYDVDGHEYDAPATISIEYISFKGTLEEVSSITEINGMLRFGYGLSRQQYEEGTAVGGKRLIAPVTELSITMKEGTDPSPDKWVQDSNGWWYRRADGTYPRACWSEIRGHWYYFNNKGYRETGWQKISSKWYYFDDDGIMLSGIQVIDGKYYYLNDSGAMQTGWKQSGDDWYYFTSSGAAITGWGKVGSKWYYFDTDGIMLTGFWSIDDKYYYLNDSGAMQTGWMQLESIWYYFNSSGAAVTGWQKINNKWYYFGSDAAMYDDCWSDDAIYYLKSGGVMATGWLETYSPEGDGPYYYYFNASGVKQVSKWINGTYYVDENGIILTDCRTPDGYYVDGNGRWVKDAGREGN